METITNAASTITTAATKAIWGEGAVADDKTTGTTVNETGGKEPLSGVVGDVKHGEPYDKGNDENATTSASGAAVVGPFDKGILDAESNAHTSTLISNPKSTDTSGINSETDNTGASYTKPSTTEKSKDLEATPIDALGSAGVATAHNEKPVGTAEAPKSADGSKQYTIGDGLGPNAVAGGLTKETHGSGTGATGAKDITSTGVKTDTDASKVDHLAEKKEAKHDPIAHPSPSTSTSTATATTTEPSKPVEEKKSLKDKIKAKLHKHKD